MRTKAEGRPSIVCFSNERWEGGQSRTPQLMTRFGRHQRVLFVEEPIFGDCVEPRLHVFPASVGLTVAVPQMPRGFDEETAQISERLMVTRLLRELGVEQPVLWYTTPRPNGRETWRASAVVYDCAAPPPVAAKDAARAEAALICRADLVFAAGHSLWRAKRAQNPRTYLVPSPVDYDHFSRARLLRDEAPPLPQAHVARPRLGYLGRIDARFDLDLLDYVSRIRPGWQIVLVGPVVGVPDERLPRGANLHYLGPQPYESLPSLLAGWDVALVPFVPGGATRFIHPAKIGAYLAAGCPVVSTAVPDILDAYGASTAVRIAATPQDFVDQAAAAIGAAGRPTDPTSLPYLLVSWDETWLQVDSLLAEVLRGSRGKRRHLDSSALHTLGSRLLGRVSSLARGIAEEGRAPRPHPAADGVEAVE